MENRQKEEEQEAIKKEFKALYKVYFYNKSIIDVIDVQEMTKNMKLIYSSIIKDFGLGIENIKKINPNIKISKNLNKTLDDYLEFRKLFFETIDFSKIRTDKIKKLIHNFKPTLDLFYYEIVKEKIIDENSLYSNEVLLDRIYDLQNKVEDHVLVRNNFIEKDYYKILFLYKDLLESIDNLSDLEDILTGCKTEDKLQNNISILSNINILEQRIDSILNII